MILHEYDLEKVYVGKADHDADLLEFIAELAEKKGVGVGFFSALGAVKKARISYYNQEKEKYEDIEFDEHMEIAQCQGNISRHDGEVAVHSHITLCDEEGNAYGGHLERGTVVFACEFWLVKLNGPQLERGEDSETKLPLWQE